MSVRILHCGSSLDNYYLCVRDKVAGFTRRVASLGDTVYLAVRVGKTTYCGARGVLSDVTDHRSWEDADLYPQAFKMEDVVYCNPFDISALSEVGGQYWNLKYLQGAKAIKDTDAIELLERLTQENIIELPYEFEKSVLVDDSYDELISEESDLTQADSKISIMGTFLTVKFKSEQDPVSGLEALVSENFYQLFDEFSEDRTVLISDNRKFRTAGLSNAKSERISGISGIPDALLIKFSKGEEHPLQINLVEYECYGETKVRAVEKFNYMNGHIIPQLMRFASTFSVVTDAKIREQTVKSWADKVIEYIYSDDGINEKVAGWVRQLRPGIKEQQISLELSRLLIDAFQSNLRIALIIDELTPEQRDTIKNVVNSFKLEHEGKPVEFISYVVRLQQRINIVDTGAEYAISVQK